MVLISKHDKKIWDKYISNFEKRILITNKKNLNTKKNHQIGESLYKISEFRKKTSLFEKRKLKPDATLDLHGYNLYSAKSILHKYLIDCYDKNIRNVLIITGKGRNNNGVLKNEVPKWLTDSILKKFLVRYEIAPKNFGGEGALLLRIKNKYKNHN